MLKKAKKYLSALMALVLVFSLVIPGMTALAADPADTDATVSTTENEQIETVDVSESETSSAEAPPPRGQRGGSRGTFCG